MFRDIEFRFYIDETVTHPENERMATTPELTPPEGKYRIGVVTRLTGLSADVVRVWERRYGAIRPARSDGGTRLYSDADITRLRKLRQAVEKGHGIGQAAKLADAELDQIVSDSEQAAGAIDVHATVRERFLDAIQKMDVVAADLELSRAAALFPAQVLTVNIIAPILDEIGERWAHQELGVAHEHVASGLLRNLLSSLLRLYPPSGRAETMVLATPATERHEFGVLLAALLAATRGWRVVYLGVDLPSADIAFAVRMTGARRLALSVATHSPQIEEEFEALARLLPDSTRVWVGGAEAATYRQLIERAGWSLVRDLEHLDDRLRS